jgi:hypothetical protein
VVIRFEEDGVRPAFINMDDDDDDDDDFEDPRGGRGQARLDDSEEDDEDDGDDDGDARVRTKNAFTAPRARCCLASAPEARGPFARPRGARLFFRP